MAMHYGPTGFSGSGTLPPRRVTLRSQLRWWRFEMRRRIRNAVRALRGKF